MSVKPKVTVFMSCYNHEKFVAEAMDSILNQTYRNLELFVVNDGSTDRSGEIIASYVGDNRVHFINLAENTGAIGAFRIINRHIAETNSKYVAGASSDDKWELTKLEKQIAFLEAHMGYKACFTWDSIIYEEDCAQWTLGEGYSFQENRNRYQWFRKFYNTGNCLNAVSMVMLRDVYLELGGYDWAYKQLQDFELWLSLVQKYQFYIMPEKLTCYRRHGGNISAREDSGVRHVNEQMHIYQKLFAEMPNDYFKKAFYPDFIYHNATDDKELLAEKIVLLLRRPLDVYRQVGFGLYLDNSRDSLLLELLETRYGLSPSVFHTLTGHCGLPYRMLRGIPEYAEQDQYTISPLLRLFDCFDLGKPFADRLYEFHQNVMGDLLSICLTMDGGVDNFYKLRGLIWGQQDRLRDISKQGRLCLVLGEDSIPDGSLEDYIPIDQEYGELYYLLLPGNKSMFENEKEKSLSSSGAFEKLELFDREEHRIRYFWEVGMEPDAVVFINCSPQDYPMWEVLDTLPLATRVYAVGMEYSSEAVSNGQELHYHELLLRQL